MTERDDDAEGSDDDAEGSGGEHGITDEDMKRIEAFCAKRRFERSADDL